MAYKDDDGGFWSICPICGEDAVIKGDNIWMCTDCGAYCED